jgi:hypothetical protein
LFDLSKRNEAVNRIQKLVGSGFEVTSAGRFVVASASGQSKSQLREMAGKLEMFLDFYQSEYEMIVPSHFITVYLVPSSDVLGRLAGKIHGIRTAGYCIGYSFQDDLAVVGLIRGTAIGTLAHELFHLLVHANFGDIPPWMDEGTAALYEVSRVESDRIKGVPNWRGPILKTAIEAKPHLRPPIKSLVSMDWRAFDNQQYPEATEKQAFNHATARYFILYLQEKQKLAEVYRAFRDRKVTDLKEDPGADAVELLEKLLEQNLKDVDEDFLKWFDTLGHMVIPQENMEEVAR